MEWYIPITVLPGLGLLLLSTTNQLLSLSSEVGQLLEKRCMPFQLEIAELKIKQLRRITRATTLLYLSAASLVLSGLAGSFLKQRSDIPEYIMVAGVVFVLLALIILIGYSYKAIDIRKYQHSNNQNNK